MHQEKWRHKTCHNSDSRRKKRQRKDQKEPQTFQDLNMKRNQKNVFKTFFLFVHILFHLLKLIGSTTSIFRSRKRKISDLGWICSDRDDVTQKKEQEGPRRRRQPGFFLNCRLMNAFVLIYSFVFPIRKWRIDIQPMIFKIRKWN